jgi:hypothetical protein
MKRSIFYAFIACTVLVAAGCQKSQPESTGTGVRILNATSWMMEECIVDPSGAIVSTPGPNSHNYGPVGVNSASDYHRYEEIYRYAWIRLTMNGKTYYLQPIDFVGETPLPDGHFTYKISYIASGDRLSLELIKD